MSDWKWQIGILQGLGECFFQSNEVGQIRQLTQALVMPDGAIIFRKALICAMSEAKDVELPNSLVLASRDPVHQVTSALDQAWFGGSIIPVNGNPRIKLI